MNEAATFTCSICAEPSTDICVCCTKDACRNHRCIRCKRCSDCCECDVPMTAPEPEVVAPPSLEVAHVPNGHGELPPSGLEIDEPEP